MNVFIYIVYSYIFMYLYIYMHLYKLQLHVSIHIYIHACTYTNTHISHTRAYFIYFFYDPQEKAICSLGPFHVPVTLCGGACGFVSQGARPTISSVQRGDSQPELVTKNLFSTFCRRPSVKHTFWKLAVLIQNHIGNLRYSSNRNSLKYNCIPMTEMITKQTSNRFQQFLPFPGN